VTDIVEGVVGAGNARVQVSAEMDFNRVSETSERFDPEGRVVRSTQTSEETSSNGERTQATTAGANIPDATAVAPASSAQSGNSSTQETVNYEISRTTRTEVSEGGRIRRLSVAVAVDGVTAPGQGENAQPQWQPRSAEEMQRLTQLVQSAVGYNQQRGDVVEVVNTQFARTPVDEGGVDSGGFMGALGNLDVMRIIEIVGTIIASLAFVFFVLRPLVAGLLNGGAQQQPVLPAGPGALPALPGAAGASAPGAGQSIAAALAATEADDATIDIAQINGRVRASSVKKVAEVVSRHPDESVQIIRGWVNNAL
jgi:flagellar M-ring protein FliF